MSIEEVAEEEKDDDDVCTFTRAIECILIDD